MITFDYSLLKEKIAAKYRTQANFAKAMGLSKASISLKLNGKVKWKLDEIARVCQLLDIPATAIPACFFHEAAEQEARHDP